MRISQVKWLTWAAWMAIGLQLSDAQGYYGNCDPSKWALPVRGEYNTRGTVASEKLNVHLIAHSHDDAGWLLTVDQYYMEQVQFILDTVVEEFVANLDRQFTFVEQAFFQRWWHEQTDKTKYVVRELVHQGRLDLSVNDGWCMHDEATTHYTAMLDQTALGHRLLKEEFGVTPRIGWQIDPFGHSATQGSLLSTGVGFDALYFARMDHADYAHRKANKDLEFLWRPSKSRGKHLQVFTGVIMDHYAPPGLFNFGNSQNEIQDDPELHDFDICRHVSSFVDIALERGVSTKGNHIFISMGDDFQYENARHWFKNMDKLVHYVNQDSRVNLLYSNLSYYTDLKLAEELTWSVTTDDFFPYASDSHQYWTGYFASRLTLKRFVRIANTLLQQMRQVEALYQQQQPSDLPTKEKPQLETLEHAVALLQHHDSVSATEKQHVADDYALRLNEGILDAQSGLNDVFAAAGMGSEKAKELTFEFCLLANISICEVSTFSENFEVLVYNPLARTSVQTISIPVSFKDPTVRALSSATPVRKQEVFVAVPVHVNQEAAPFSLVFSAELDPLSDARFLVSVAPAEPETFESQPVDPDPLVPESSDPQPLEPEPKENGNTPLKGDDPEESALVILENGLVRATIDPSTGSLVSITNKASGIELPLSLSVMYYEPSEGRANSGAYIFSPFSKIANAVAGNATAENGGGVTLLGLHVGTSATDNDTSSKSRVAFRIADWVTLEYRVNDGDAFLEIEWTVGSIPFDDSVGKEVIVRFDTQSNISSAKTLFTDSNGLEFVPREFVAANYYPTTAGAFIKDDTSQLNVVTDRAQGVASLKDGQLEVMVHRRLSRDDSKGVQENLDETEFFYNAVAGVIGPRGLIARGNFHVSVDSVAEGMRSIRAKMEKQFYAPLVAFRKAEESVKSLSENDLESKAIFPWLKVNEDFPENVGLTTLQALSVECALARLTHLFAVDEHAELSKSVEVDFSKLFTTTSAAPTTCEVTELLLTGVAPLSSQARKPYTTEWKTEEPEEVPVGVDATDRQAAFALDGTQVKLQAMEVRTFRVCFKADAA